MTPEQHYAEAERLIGNGDWVQAQVHATLALFPGRTTVVYGPGGPRPAPIHVIPTTTGGPPVRYIPGGHA